VYSYQSAKIILKRREKMENSKHIKFIGISAVAMSLLCTGEVLSSGKPPETEQGEQKSVPSPSGKPPETKQEEQKSVPAKIGRETARIEGQAKDAASDFKGAFKGKHKKDKEKRKKKEK